MMLQVQQQRANHVCDGVRCPCQRYENGELALVVMNRNRNHGNQDREDSYQNIGRGQQRPAPSPRMNNGLPANPNFLNPQYQNPVDLLRNYNRNGRINEPEENIYERLDNDEDEDGEEEENMNENEDEQRAEGLRNENALNPSLELHNADNHMYERIDNRSWYRGAMNNRPANETHASSNLPSANFWNFIEPSNSNNHYDHPRYVYARTINQSCVNRLGRLGRNCFSSENIAAATSTRRYVYQLGHSRMCQSCTRFPFGHRDVRYACHYCNAFHDRFRYYENGNSASQLGNSRHYIYQVTRSCRCPFCRGDYHYTRFPMNTGRLAESFPRDCQCRNPGNCNCRGRMISSSNSAIYIGRIDRMGLVQTVNNPLYSSPTIYIGRIDRSCASGLSSNSGFSGITGNPSNSGESSSNNSAGLAPVPSVSGASTSQNEAATSGSQRGSTLNSAGTSTTSAVCSIAGNSERQHVCDDSCIRTNSGNLTGVCQFLARNERSECQHGRVSFHWWFVNRWLPPWGSQSQSNDRNQANLEPQQPLQAAPRIDETRERHESDTEESRD
ncbi:uncharacterized protein [Venturia canescens]|uniref:uncharacterized protein n=1 Tax=Venturia canescens TaxID=32260 RepID=UPI001C9C7CF2|nr:uncharacterized protein LOC122407692 [Venturia canescens]